MQESERNRFLKIFLTLKPLPYGKLMTFVVLLYFVYAFVLFFKALKEKT